MSCRQYPVFTDDGPAAVVIVIVRVLYETSYPRLPWVETLSRCKTTHNPFKLRHILNFSQFEGIITLYSLVTFFQWSTSTSPESRYFWVPTCPIITIWGATHPPRGHSHRGPIPGGYNPGGIVRCHYTAHRPVKYLSDHFLVQRHLLLLLFHRCSIKIGPLITWVLRICWNRTNLEIQEHSMLYKLSPIQKHKEQIWPCHKNGQDQPRVIIWKKPHGMDIQPLGSILKLLLFPSFCTSSRKIPFDSLFYMIFCFISYMYIKPQGKKRQPLGTIFLMKAERSYQCFKI